MDIGRRLTLLILDVGDKRTAPIYWAGLTGRGNISTLVLYFRPQRAAQQHDQSGYTKP
jgi:hypothetical protein